MEKELFIIQQLLKESNDHIKAIRRWVTIAGVIFIIIPIGLIILFFGAITSLVI